MAAQAIRRSFLALFTKKALATYVQLQDGVIRRHLAAWIQVHGGREFDIKHVIRCPPGPHRVPLSWIIPPPPPPGWRLYHAVHCRMHACVRLPLVTPLPPRGRATIAFSGSTR